MLAAFDGYARRILYSCLAILLLAGCIRASSINPGFTHTPQTATSEPIESLTRSVTLTKAPEASSTNPLEPILTSSPTPEIDSLSLAATATEFAGQSQRTLAAFPLQVGNSWVYAYQAYTGDEKATWQVVDTIIDIRQSAGLSAFEMQQDVNLVAGTPSQNFINAPLPGNYWYILVGNNVYRQDSLNWPKVTLSSLELVWPFPVQGCWFPDAEQRSNPALPLQPDFPGCRSAQGPVTLQLKTGSVDRCYHLKTPYNDGPTFDDFCEQVGFVGGKFDHAGTPFGMSYQLIAYSLQNK